MSLPITKDQLPPPYSKKDAEALNAGTIELPEVLSNSNHTSSSNNITPSRPPIDYTSFHGFFESAWRRFESLWTKRFVWSLLAGQVVSLCITCTNVTTTELVSRNWALPTTQTFFLWVLDLLMGSCFRGEWKYWCEGIGIFLCLWYIRRTRFINVGYWFFLSLFFFFCWCRGFVTDFENCLDGWKGWANLIFRDGWKCKCFMSSQSTIASTHLFRRYHPGSMWCRRKLLGRKGELSHLIQFIVEKLWQSDFFFENKAYQYTTLLSCMLLDAWAIPVCVAFSWLLMRPKYKWTQIIVSIYIFQTLAQKILMIFIIILLLAWIEGCDCLCGWTWDVSRFWWAHGQRLASTQPCQRRHFHDRRSNFIWIQYVPPTPFPLHYRIDWWLFYGDIQQTQLKSSSCENHHCTKSWVNLGCGVRLSMGFKLLLWNIKGWRRQLGMEPIVRL